jgi:hypothetical protein
VVLACGLSVELNCFCASHATAPAKLVAQGPAIPRFCMAVFRRCNEQREGFVVIALAFVEQPREVPVGKIVLRKGVGSVGKSLKDLSRLFQQVKTANSYWIAGSLVFLTLARYISSVWRVERSEAFLPTAFRSVKL